MNPRPAGDVYSYGAVGKGGGHTRRTRAVGRHRRRRPISPLELRLRVAGALLLAASASIHLYLYLTGYRSIPTIGWLFLMQFIVGYILTVAVLVTHSRIAAAASAAFALSTISAYLLAIWGGLFGFREIRTRAGIAAGLIEVAAFGVLIMASIAADPIREADESVSSMVRLLARVQAAVSMIIGGIGVVSVLALALLGIGLANAGGARLGRRRRHQGGPEDRGHRRRHRAHQRPGPDAVPVRPRHPDAPPSAPGRARRTGRRSSAGPKPGRA